MYGYRNIWLLLEDLDYLKARQGELISDTVAQVTLLYESFLFMHQYLFLTGAF